MNSAHGHLPRKVCMLAQYVHAECYLLFLISSCLLGQPFQLQACAVPLQVVQQLALLLQRTFVCLLNLELILLELAGIPMKV